MPPFFMNISALIAYLSDPANAADCAQLRAEKPTSINQIQQAIAAYPQAPVRDLLTLFRLQDANNHKFSHAHHLMLSDKAAQQASSSCLAAYHASKMQPGWHVADLCCGVGVDLQAFATRASHVFALDASDEVLAMARFNAAVANHTNISFCASGPRLSHSRLTPFMPIRIAENPESASSIQKPILLHYPPF